MPAAERVSKGDIEAKIRQIRGEAGESAGAAKPTLLAAGAAGAALLVLLAFALGKRRGRRKSTVVEIRRV